MKKNLCVFASYSKNNRVYNYVLLLLKGIKEELNCDIYFSTASQEINRDDEQKLKTLCVGVEQIENRYDFGSYFNGLKKTKNWKSYERVFFINDSIYGPVYPFNDIYKEMTTKECDVWSLTEGFSYGKGYHLQSYFLCFNKTSYDVLTQFVENYQYPKEYLEVIKQGEIGLTQTLLNAGLRVRSYVSKSDFVSKIFDSNTEMIVSLNQKRKKAVGSYLLNTNFLITFWKECLDYYKLPVLKVKLIKEEQFFSLHFGKWHSYCGEELKEAIEEHIHYELTLSDVKKSKLTPFKAYSRFFKNMFNPTIFSREMTNVQTLEEAATELKRVSKKDSYFRPESNLFRL